MVFPMKQSLSLTTSQQLTLTPQLKQSLKLLQLSAFDLEQEVQTELEANPLLEKVEKELSKDELPPEHTPLRDNNIPQPIGESSEPEAEMERTDNLAPEQDLALNLQENFHDFGSQRPTPSAASSDFEIAQLVGQSETLVDHLLWQLQMTTLSERDQEIGRTLIHNLDEDGYLTVSVEEIHRHLNHLIDIEEDEIQAVLSLIKTFDPLGVGAANLKERLTILLGQCTEQSAYALAANIIDDYLDLLGSRQFIKIKKALNVSQDDMVAAIELITSLQPRIALQFSQDKQDHVVPDLIVGKDKDQWVVQVNPDNQIRLRVNDLYASLLKQGKEESLNESDSEYIQSHMAQAKMFIKGLMSRYDTLLLVGQAIVERQQAFFEQGEQAMQAMVLADIAETLELHESTISRATAGKYLLCPRGLFELKYFFSSALSNTEGTTSSSTAIRSLIKTMVDNEDKNKPLSDSKIAKQLEQQGHIVARRTVAKYRESLQIAPSSQRKVL